MKYDGCNTPKYWSEVWTKWRWSDKKDHIKAMYDRANTPEYWDKIWKSPKRRTEKYAMQWTWWRIKEAKAKSVLDVGCGNGRMLFGVKDKCETFGIDISPVAIKRMKDSYGVDGAVMNAYDVDKIDRTFDFVVCNHTLEHIWGDEEVVRKCKDKLNDGGTFLAAVPNDMSGPEEEPEHVRKYDEKMLRALLEKVFGNCKIKIIGNHLIAWSVKKQ